METKMTSLESLSKITLRCTLAFIFLLVNNDNLLLFVIQTQILELKPLPLETHLLGGQ